MQLFLVRHAIAGKPDLTKWVSDDQRPLTTRGTERFVIAARGLRKLVPRVDVVLTSPYVRAQETAAILSTASHWPSATLFTALTPFTEPADTASALRALSDVPTLALVGHEPHLSRLASYLLTGDAGGAAIEFRKGSVAAFAIPGLVDGGTAELQWLLTPRALRRMAEA